VARLTRITSRSNPLLMQLRKLAEDGSAYRRLGMVLLEGEHLCAAWQAKGDAPVLHAVVSEAAWAEPRLRELAAAAAEIAVVSGPAMAAFSALDSPAPIAFLVAVPAAKPIQADAPTVVLDRIQDPGNVGALLRSAAAFGFTQAIALAGTAALWAPKVLRAAMGAHFGLRLVEGADPDALAALAVPLFGTSSHAAERVDAFALPWPCAWAFGHEGQGIAADLAARCAAMLAIPQPGGQESLNVAAAAAVCLYESARQRSL
jgi:RNA methyltransferase, TrmH family